MPDHTVAVATSSATLRLTVRPGCTERDVMDLVRWAWAEVGKQRTSAPAEREAADG